MGKPTRLASHGTFFISTQTWNRHRLFQSPTNATLFLETLQHDRAQGHRRLLFHPRQPEGARLQPCHPTPDVFPGFSR